MTVTPLQCEPTTIPHTPTSTSFELHTPATLLACPHLPTLFNLINRAFDHSHHRDGCSRLPPSEKARLQTHSQLGEELGPNGFILLMLQAPTSSSLSSPAATATEGFISPAGHRIIGTASAKPYHPSNPMASSIDSHMATHLFKRPTPSWPRIEAVNDGGGIPQWEILAMGVDPLLQGRGLATQLMDSIIEEIKRRCGHRLGSAAFNAAEEDRKGSVILLLSTMRELNENYYLRRGWTTTDTRSFPPGTMGSRDGFSVVDMFKCVAL